MFNIQRQGYWTTTEVRSELAKEIKLIRNARKHYAELYEITPEMEVDFQIEIATIKQLGHYAFQRLGREIGS